MTTALPPIRYTPDEVLRLEDEGLFELVDGKLVEKTMSALASKTAGLIGWALVDYCKRSNAGDVFPEQAFQCFPHEPEMIRRPDIAFVSSERSPGVPDEGHVTVAPDLAIEVVSPNDKVYELDEKLADYRAAGIKLVWVVNPLTRSVRVYQPNGTSIELRENDAITGENVLPGFSAHVNDFFPARK